MRRGNRKASRIAGGIPLPRFSKALLYRDNGGSSGGDKQTTPAEARSATTTTTTAY